MDWGQELQRERDFLRDYLAQAQHKVQRLASARIACQDCLEAEGLARMQHQAQLEVDTLADLLARQMSDDALSLDALLLRRARSLQREAQRESHGWRRGHPTPADYWDAESQLAFVLGLLRRYHAWQADRPYYPDRVSTPARDSYHGGNGVGANGRSGSNGHHEEPVFAHPWYILHPDEVEQPDEEPPTHTELDDLRDEMLARLVHDGFPEQHLELTVQDKGPVILTGYAHGEDDAIAIVDTVVSMAHGWDVLADIKIVDADHCPVCHPPGDNGRLH